MQPIRRLRLATVAEASRPTPRTIRLVLDGDDLHDFAVGEHSDSYVKLQLPPRGAPYRAPFDVEEIRARLPREQWPRTRTLTVRAWDADRRRLTIDFVDHGDVGIAGPWAAAAQPGDPVQILGPGGGYAPDPAADWHLMVGDPSALPAIAASLERVPVSAPVIALIAVEDGDEEIALQSAGDLRVTWLRSGRAHRAEAGGSGSGGADQLVGAVTALEFPAGRVHAFVHGEAEMVRAVRRHLVVERGVAVEALSASGYWKRSRTDEGWREDKAEWKRLVDEDAATLAADRNRV